MNNNDMLNESVIFPTLDTEILPEGLEVDDQEPEPRNDNDEESWEDDTERDDTPFLTEDNLWEDMHDTGDY